MNRYADPEPYTAEELSMLAADPDYSAFLDSTHEPDEEHSTCDQYNPFGLCEDCEDWYQRGLAQGASDFANGVSYDDGAAFWRASHPQIPQITGGAIEGYGHGWTNASLRSILRTVELPYYEIR